MAPAMAGRAAMVPEQDAVESGAREPVRAPADMEGMVVQTVGPAGTAGMADALGQVATADLVGRARLREDPVAMVVSETAGPPVAMEEQVAAQGRLAGRAVTVGMQWEVGMEVPVAPVVAPLGVAEMAALEETVGMRLEIQVDVAALEVAAAAVAHLVETRAPLGVQGLPTASTMGL